MELTPTTPTKLLTWFHQEPYHRREVLCVLLAPGLADLEKVSEITADVFGLDAILGPSITLVFPDPAGATPLGLPGDMGRMGVLGGLGARPTAAPPEATTPVGAAGRYLQPVRDHPLFHDLSAEAPHYRPKIAVAATHTMARVVPEFMKVLGVKPTDLPAVCVVVCGLPDAVVIPLEADWSPETLRTLLLRVREATDGLPDFREGISFLIQRAPAPLERLDDHERELTAKRRALTKALDGLSRRYGATEPDKDRMAAFAAGDVAVPGFDEMVEGLSFAANARFRKDGQLSKARRVIDRLVELRELLSEAPFHSYSRDVGERVEALEARRRKLYEALTAMAGTRLVRTPGIDMGRLASIWQGMERSNLLWDVGGKVLALKAFIQALLGPGT